MSEPDAKVSLENSLELLRIVRQLLGNILGGGETSTMSTAGPANMAEALELIDSGMRFLAGMNKAGMPCEALAAGLRALEQHDAVEAAARGEMLAVYDGQGGPPPPTSSSQLPELVVKILTAGR
jgi:hypothetical protein